MKRTIALLAVTSGLLVTGGAASATVAQGADKFPLIGPGANLFCNGLAPVDTLDEGDTLNNSFVVFNESDGVLKATVSLKGAQPNTVYAIRLLQTSGADCFVKDGEITTNRQGNGTLHLAEVTTGVSAQVVVDPIQIGGLNGYRATESYVFAP